MQSKFYVTNFLAAYFSLDWNFNLQKFLCEFAANITKEYSNCPKSALTRILKVLKFIRKWSRAAKSDTGLEKFIQDVIRRGNSIFR